MVAQNNDNLLPARRVWAHFGITPRTLDRWLQDPRMGFPAPLVINGRRYWRDNQITAWERTRSTEGVAA